MRFTLAIFSFIMSVVVGTFVLKRYRMREKFFSDFVDFLNHARSEIGFFQNRLSNVFCSFDAGDSQFEQILKDKAKEIEGEKACEKPKFVSQNEWLFVNGVLSKLGQADSQTELNVIDAAIEKAKVEKEKSKKERATKGVVGFKLSFALGAALAIVLM